jgi:hypothetical protein
VSAGQFLSWSDDFPTSLARFDKQLADLGWYGQDADGLIRRYKENVSRLTNAGTSRAQAKIDAVDQLYDAYYRRGPDQLTVSFAASTKGASEPGWMYLSDEVNSRAAVKELRGSGSVVLMREHREFYRV